MTHIIDWSVFGTVLTEEDGYNGNMRGLRFSEKNLRKIRKDLKLTQKQLAKGAGVGYVTVQHLEQGILGNPTYDVVTKISRYLSEVADYKIAFWLDHDYVPEEQAPDPEEDAILEDDTDPDFSP